MYKVLFESNDGSDDCIMEFETVQEAEECIEEQLEEMKEFYEDICVGYDYGDSHYERGLSTEIWEIGGGGYACWTRLWT